MKKPILISALVVAVVVLYSCHKEKEDTLTTTAYLDLPAQMFDYFPDPNLSNKKRDSLSRLATLGRVLFYDTHLSINNAISCGSCHKQELGFADNVQFSRGFEGKLTGRNTPGISGLQSSGILFWDGRETKLDNLIMRPVSNHVEMGIDDLGALPAKLQALSYYDTLFTAAFKDNNITLERISMAVSFFMQCIGRSGAGGINVVGPGQLSALQQEGKALFDTVYDCGSCHKANTGYTGGSNMLDIGLDEVYTDKGRGAITGNNLEMGMFKVPNLTNVALSAPYMHDGRFRTLDEVLEHYSQGIRNSPNLTPILKNRNPNIPGDKGTAPIRMNITEKDKKAIIAFLGTLTDQRGTTEEKFSNPFKSR